jgi:hypothetical protein
MATMTDTNCAVRLPDYPSVPPRGGTHEYDEVHCARSACEDADAKDLQCRGRKDEGADKNGRGCTRGYCDGGRLTL